jgi:hypothetical protein
MSSRFEMNGNGSLADNPRKLGHEKPAIVARSLRWREWKLHPDRHIVTMQTKYTLGAITGGVR